MKQKFLSCFIAILLCFMCIPLSPVNAATVLTANKTGSENGYDYELWKDHGNTTMTLGANATFDCSWNNIGNALFRTGKRLGCTQKWSDYNGIYVDYACDYKPSGNSYLCVYGWTRTPLIEYYIVDSWGSWRPPGGQSKGTINVDGGTYDIYVTDRINQPSIDGNTTFKQYWSVRTSKRTSGTISVSDHFKAWEARGMKMGTMYEVSLTVEGYQSSGSASVTKNVLSLGTTPPTGTTQSGTPHVQLTTVPYSEPTGSGKGISDTFEGTGTDWTARGDVTVGLTNSFKHGGSKSLYVTDRTQAWHGFSASGADLKGGGSYSFEGYVGFNDSNYSSHGFTVGVQYDSGGSTSYDDIASATANSGSWAKLSGDFTVPSDAANVSLYVQTTYTENPTAEDLIDFYLDDVKFTSSGSQTVITTTPVTSGTIYGDVNCDGQVTSSDLIPLINHFLNSPLTGQALLNADVIYDKSIALTDLARLKQYLTGDKVTLGYGAPVTTTTTTTTTTPPVTTAKPVEKSYNFSSVNQLKSSSAIPDPFVYTNGSKVSSPSDWSSRASEISCMYEYYMYGKWRDGSDDQVSYKISGNTMTVNVKRISTGKTTSFPVNINRPSSIKHEGGAPVIVGMHSGISEATATKNGYAVLTIGGSMFSNPVASDDTSHKGAFYDLYPYGNTWEEQTGVLMAWSWGCSKILDALEAGAAQELNINSENAIVTGVSRWGKAAMVCGAYEPRFKMCAPSCSGAGGVAMYRYTSQGKTYNFSTKGGPASYTYGQNEPLGSLQSTAERGWFNNRFLEFKNVNQLPMDQHMLCSLVADKDRYLFIIGSCVSEDWVNAPAMWLTYKATRVIYKYLGIEDNIAINIHKEGHAVIAEDVNYMCQYFDHHVYGKSPSIDLKNLQTSVFELGNNNDPFFSSFNSGWSIK